ncbi:MAG TPA: 16S rRNA (cytosine(1402)-N(4))-methyltransferase RsmH, partial [Magnetospirillaceae bacterium]|nr:16S rRNA (cytosine(1402)-N(4))-methyltransferase RsmH [Magnetospirillaceae bacterium]
YLDLTAGYAGHAKQVIDAIGDAHLVTLVDRDDFAIAALQPIKDTGARIIHQDFASAAADLHRAGEQFDMILLDLGVSSPQLDIAGRGFSFLQDGPLDMRMDQQKGRTAADICNKASLDELVQLLRDYGEQPNAYKIARAIMAARPLTTTSQLANVVLNVHRGPWQKSHPATRTFQALRIAVNQELQQLASTLKLIPDLLKPGGRVAIISFHSLEDRMVKRFFKEEQDAGYEARLQVITKQAISGADQDAHNPRARSAKLRAAVNIK